MIATTHTETAIGNYSFFDVEVIVENPNGVEGPTNKNTFSVYTNHASKVLYVDSKSNEHATVEIYTMNGSIVRSQTVHNGINEINIGNFDNGMYLVKLQSVSGSMVKKTTVFKM